MADGQSTHFGSWEDPVLKAAKQISGAQWNAPDRFLAFLWSLRKFDSVAEFGCATADWLRATRKFGATTIHGYDIPELTLEQRLLTEEEFTAADLGKDIALERRFDLAISTEVGEHVPVEAAATFVRNITRASDWVLYGAAPPFQGGMNHINENWVEFWARLFAAEGYLCYDILRPHFWHDPNVAFYYRQNTLLYVKATKDQALTEARYLPTARPMSMIHPEHYLRAVASPAHPLKAIIPAIRGLYPGA
jgi:hypothetical protein